MNLTNIIQKAKAAENRGIISRTIPCVDFIGIDVHLDGGAIVCTLTGSDVIIGNPIMPAIHGGVIGEFL